MKRKIRATKRCRWRRSGVTTTVKRWQTNAALDLGQSFFFVSLFFRSRAWEESPGSRNTGLDANPAIASGWNLEGTYCVLGRFPVGTRVGTGISFLNSGSLKITSKSLKNRRFYLNNRIYSMSLRVETDTSDVAGILF
jgi:hypothetical protein